MNVVRDMRTVLPALLPLALVAIVLWRNRRARRVAAWKIVVYLLFLAAAISAAMYFVAWIAGARVPPAEIAVVVWFAIGLRLAWELWRCTIGRAGQRWVRWNRRARRRGAARWLPALIRPARGIVAAVVFFPLALSFVLTHRFRLADGTDPRTTLSLPYEDVRIRTEDGLTLAGWYVPCKGATSTILICHGAGANKGNFIWFLTPLAYRGCNLLLFDFRAHGGSEGWTCTYGLLEKRDVRAAVDWLKRERPAGSEKVIGLGSSLGAMALALAAADEPTIDAVVLDSPFTSPRDFADHHLGRLPVLGPALTWVALHEMSWLTGADFWNTSAERAVAGLGPRPVYVVHGADDVLMPASHSRRLFDAASGPRGLWMGPGPHSNIITTEPEEYAERLFRFLGENGLVARSAPREEPDSGPRGAGGG